MTPTRMGALISTLWINTAVTLCCWCLTAADARFPSLCSCVACDVGEHFGRDDTVDMILTHVVHCLNCVDGGSIDGYTLD